MMRKTNYAGFFIVLFFLGCVDEDCKKVTSVAPVFSAAMEFPETFDEYVSNNQNLFDEDFFRCLNQRLVEIKKNLDKKTEECEKQFDGSDGWVGCYNENILGPENLLMILGTIKRVTAGETRWADTNTGLSLAVMKSSDPESWERLVAVFNEYEADTYCTFCESERCFLGICR